ncbi:MAG: protein tyrosine phosphatase [Myxococcaceae bacterium]|nr:protein tyrosine phosphatase [Myxococcaceae bacterium]
MVRICFVCLGNICRSPTAQGVLEHLVAQAGLAHAFQIESAGTASYHVGEPPDRRTLLTARAHGVELKSRAQQFLAADFERFDLVLAMDTNNRVELQRRAPDRAARDKILLLRDFEPSAGPDAAVPDPYYGEPADFEQVFTICQAACGGLLEVLRSKHGL